MAFACKEADLMFLRSCSKPGQAGLRSGGVVELSPGCRQDESRHHLGTATPSYCGSAENNADTMQLSFCRTDEGSLHANPPRGTHTLKPC